MAHIDTVVADWDMNLTPTETQMVLNPEWRSGLRFGTAASTAPGPVRYEDRPELLPVSAFRLEDNRAKELGIIPSDNIVNKE